jgi:hypothetical protein
VILVHTVILNGLQVEFQAPDRFGYILTTIAKSSIDLAVKNMGWNILGWKRNQSFVSCDTEPRTVAFVSCRRGTDFVDEPKAVWGRGDYV